MKRAMPNSARVLGLPGRCVWTWDVALELAWVAYKRREFVRLGGRLVPFGLFEALGTLARREGFCLASGRPDATLVIERVAGGRAAAGNSAQGSDASHTGSVSGSFSHPGVEESMYDV